jgi:hypothetical protein
MRVLRRWPLLALTFLVLFAASACGGSGHGTPGASRAPGASGGNEVNAAGVVSETSAANGGNQAGGVSGTSTATGGNQANGAGGAPQSSATGGGQGNADGGAPGAPGGNSGGQTQTAPGAPITIPNLIQGAGAPIDAALNSLKTGEPLPDEDTTYDGIIHQCGGTLCVNIVVQETTGPTPVLGGDAVEDPADPRYTQCQLVNIEPGPNAKVARGSTIVLVTGTKPCDSSSSDSTGSPADTAPAP